MNKFFRTLKNVSEVSEVNIELRYTWSLASARMYSLNITRCLTRQAWLPLNKGIRVKTENISRG